MSELQKSILTDVCVKKIRFQVVNLFFDYLTKQGASFFLFPGELFLSPDR